MKSALKVHFLSPAIRSAMIPLSFALVSGRNPAPISLVIDLIASALRQLITDSMVSSAAQAFPPQGGSPSSTRLFLLDFLLHFYMTELISLTEKIIFRRVLSLVSVL